MRLQGNTIIVYDDWDWNSGFLSLSSRILSTCNLTILSVHSFRYNCSKIIWWRSNTNRKLFSMKIDFQLWYYTESPLIVIHRLTHLLRCCYQRKKRLIIEVSLWLYYKSSSPVSFFLLIPRHSAKGRQTFAIRNYEIFHWECLQLIDQPISGKWNGVKGKYSVS